MNDINQEMPTIPTAPAKVPECPSKEPQIEVDSSDSDSDLSSNNNASEDPSTDGGKKTTGRHLPTPIDLTALNTFSDDDSDSDSVDIEAVFKVLVVGNARCGKTSVIRRYIHGTFIDQYTSTIGADFEEKEVDVDNQTRAVLQLWDIAGQDRFAKLTRAYFRQAKGAIVVCDITRDNTFDAVKIWKNEIDSCCADMNNGMKIPVILIANKSDLLQDPEGALETGARLRECVDAHGFNGYYITSAKRGKEVDRAVKDLMVEMMKNHKPAVSPVSQPDKDELIRLSMTALKDTTKKKKDFFDENSCNCN